MTYEIFHGIKISNGPHDNPGSGKVIEHESEYQLFKSQLNKLDQIPNPVMLEIGAFWGLWSLVFRKRFESGQNILVEYGSHQLEVGERNFRLNGYSAEFIHGGIGLEESGTQMRKETDVLYKKNLSAGVAGPELDIKNELEIRGVTRVDLVHMDIQGSELTALKHFKNSNLFDSLDMKIICVATHSALIHTKVRCLLIQHGFGIDYEELTYGKLGSVVIRILKKLKLKEKFLGKSDNSLSKMIFVIESKLKISGQINGIGRDGLLILSRR
jgi:FkbM family methyltransferase